MTGLFVAVEYTVAGKLFNGDGSGEDLGLLRRVLAEEDFWGDEDWLEEAGGAPNLAPFLAYCVMALGLGVLALMEILGHRGIEGRVEKA